MAKHKVLSCNCGDCVHWELIRREGSGQDTILCKTCGQEFPATFTVPAHGKLTWVAREETLKSDKATPVSK